MMALMPAPEAPILVVDDDPKIVALVRTYLGEEAGGRVGATSDAGTTTFWFSLPS